MTGWTDVRPGGTRAAVAAEEVVEIFVDYSLVGVGRRRFRTRVKAATRWQLRPGDTVVVHGDGVASAPARVLEVVDDRPDVDLKLSGG